jgi:hypothetical protein
LEDVDKHRLAHPRGQQWTRADDYMAAMARKRTARRNRAYKDGGEWHSEHPAIRVWPFMILVVLLGVLGVSIMVLAFPGSQPQHKPPAPAQHELGTADRGWFQQAQKEFR